jgi:hypoxanthine phosphoribosyltransferase
MKQNIEKILIHEDNIQARLALMGGHIQEDFYEEEVITVVVILTGALLFAADLIRNIDKKVDVKCIHVSSYYGGTKSTGVVSISDGIDNIKNKTVLLIDDILDTGLTLTSVKDELLNNGAKKVKTCVLLDKRVSSIKADYTGFHIPNKFVVGYGLDYQGHYRNLPYIGILKNSCIKEIID